MLLLSKLVICGLVVIFTFSSTTDAGQFVANPSNHNSKSLAIELIQVTDELREREAAEALKSINETAKMVIAAGGDKSATILCEEGFKIGFELLASCRESLNNALIIAQTLALKDSEGAVRTINSAVQRIIDYIFEVSISVHTAPGAALSKVGELARPNLKTALKLIHNCGVVLFETLNSAQRVANLGVKAGGDASNLALLAAHEVFNTGEEAIYKLLIESAESSFKGLKAAAGKALVHGFSERSDGLITKETSEAQTALNELTFAYSKLLNVLTEEHLVKAIKSIYHGFIASIFDVANAIVMAYRVIDEAETLLGRNPEISESAFHNGMLAVENAILAASADAILGLGAAGEICNGKVVGELKAAVKSVVEGRVHLLADVMFGEKVAIFGLGTGGVAAKQGLKAARASVAAASSALFNHFIDGARKAFSVLQKANRTLSYS